MLHGPDQFDQAECPFIPPSASTSAKNGILERALRPFQPHR